MSSRPRASLAARTLTSAAVALAGTLGAHTGSAQAASLDGVDVTYTSPQECAREDEYRRLVATLLRASPPPGPPRVRAIAASIRAAAGRYRGQLSVSDADGRESAREIAAPTCDEAVNALAFLAALAMGFDVATLSPDSSRTSPGSAGASARANGGASTTPVSPASALSSPPPSGEERSKGPSLGQPAIVWSIAASLESTLGVTASRLEPGASLMLRASLGDAPVLAPSLGLGAIFANGGSVGDPGGPRAIEQLDAGWLEACPIRLRFTAHLVARPCASLVAGAMVGSASGIVGARRKALPWWGTIALARFEWSPADPVVLDLHAGVSAAFERARFYFSPDTELYAPSTVGAIGGAGVAVRFP